MVFWTDLPNAKSEINGLHMRVINRLFLSLILFGFSILLACSAESNEEIEARIARSQQLQRLNVLCSSLPKPPGVEFRYKRINGNSIRSLLTFYYSKNIPYDDAKKVYSEWFAQNGWVENLDLASTHYGYYKKENTEIAISSHDIGSLEIGCTEPN